MVDDAIGQARLVIDDQRHHVAARDIFRSHDREFVPANAFAKADIFDGAARDAAAHGSPKKHARQRKVIDVASLPRKLGCAFLTGN